MEVASISLENLAAILRDIQHDMIVEDYHKVNAYLERTLVEIEELKAQVAPQYIPVNSQGALIDVTPEGEV